MRIVCPDARKAIRLQFEPYRQCIGFALTGTALQRLNFPHDAKKILHVMADFVGDHVGLGEVTRCLEALAQFAVESKIDIEFLILAAVKRAGRRLAKSAGRLDDVREKHQGRFLISLPGRLKISLHVRSVLPSTRATNSRISSFAPVGCDCGGGACGKV